MALSVVLRFVETRQLRNLTVNIFDEVIKVLHEHVTSMDLKSALAPVLAERFGVINPDTVARILVSFCAEGKFGSVMAEELLESRRLKAKRLHSLKQKKPEETEPESKRKKIQDTHVHQKKNEVVDRQIAMLHFQTRLIIFYCYSA